MGLELLPASPGSGGSQRWARAESSGQGLGTPVCPRSLVLPFWLFPATTPHCSQHPSVTATLGTGKKEFGLVSTVLALQDGSMFRICEPLL